MRRNRGLFVTIIALAALASPGAADASAREVAGRVLEQWRAAGARASMLPTRFVFDDESIVIPVPREEERACTHVAVVGARGLSFRARLSDAPADPLLSPEPDARASSSAGVLELRRCDDGGARVHHVVVTAEAGRGAIEVIVGRADEPLPSLGSIIPERTGGVIPPPAKAGALPPLPPLDERLAAAELRARREGARAQTRASVLAGRSGSGSEELELEAGCHRVELFGQALAGGRLRLDVDAELREDGELLARDRTEAPDARLEACVGARTRASLAFAGAPPGSEVIVTRSSWPLPPRIPLLWGPEARRRMARVMFLRRAAPTDEPVLLAQGTSGPASVPISVETGGCYVAVVGVARGSARQLQLRTLLGARESTDERGASEGAALSAFCVRAHERPRLEVVARGTGLSWGLALYRMKSGVWEEGR